MRITALIPEEQVLSNLNTVTNAILNDQAEASTGRALTMASDNPAAFTQDETVRTLLGQVGTWTKVAGSALSVAESTDQTLSSIEQAVSTAYALGVSATGPNGTSGAATIAGQLSGLLASIGQLANTEMGGIYLLGGQSTTPPWAGGSSTTVSSGPPMQVSVGSGVSVNQNFSGGPLLSTVLAGIEGLAAVVGAPQTGQAYKVQVQFNYGTGSPYTTSTAYTSSSPPGTIVAAPPSGAPTGVPTSITAVFQLGSATVDQVNVPVTDFQGGQVSFQAPTWGEMVGGALAQLQSAQDQLVAAHAQFGANMQRIQAAKTTLASQQTSLQATQASLEDASIPQVVANLSTQETVYQAVLQSASAVMQPTLANYLNQIG